MGPIYCSETSVRNYHYLLSNDPVGRSSFLVTNFTYLTLYLSGEDDSGYLSITAVLLVLLCCRLLKCYLRRRQNCAYVCWVLFLDFILILRELE